MFRQVYKSTLKNLLRSELFLFMVIILGGVSVYESIVGFQIQYEYDSVTGALTMIKDTSPAYILGYGVYIKKLTSAVCYDVMSYTMPLITVLSTVLVLNRDYGDNFYEIEKCASMRPTTYLFGRIAALITVNFSLATIASFVSFHVYIISRGGLSTMGTLYYITDSSIRLMRLIVLMAFPTILFYIGITYLLGCIFRSGLYSSIISIGYVMFLALPDLILGGIVPQAYCDYFAPIPKKLELYLYWYDTYGFNTKVTQQEAILAFLFIPAAFLLTLFVSYILIRKRDK